MGKSVLCLFFPLLLLGCGEKGKETPLVWKIEFFPLGAKLHIPSSVKSVAAFNREGMKVARLDFPVPPRQVESLYFKWREGERYRFEIVLANSDISVRTVTAPQVQTRGSLEISIPYGAAVTHSQSTPPASLVLHNSDVTATVLLKNGNADVNADFRVQLCLPQAITVVSLPKGWIEETLDEQICLSTSGTFTVAGEVWYSELVLKIHEVSDNSNNTTIRGRVRFEGDETWEQQVQLRVRSATVEEIGGLLSIESVQMPTDAVGVVDARQRTDTLYHAQPVLGRWRHLSIDAYEPVAYQTVKLHNHGQETIHVVISAINRDANSGETVPFLTPPDAVNAGTDRSVAFASLPPQMLSSIPLPIYLDMVAAQAGDYKREIEVKIWGSRTTVLRAERPLQIIIPNRHALFVTGAAVMVSIIGLGVVLRFHNRFFSLFSTKQLIVIALFGATVFVCVIIPSTLFMNLIRSVLGPVSVLLTGLVNETLYYALLTALLFYIGGEPRGKRGTGGGKPGVILLVSAVGLLLGGITFGLFTPMMIIYTSTSVLLLETGFWFVQHRGLLAWAVALGICDALAVYVDFQLSIVFYRLFYAEWYMFLRIFVEGFAYTFIGVLLGARLGRGLWRVSD